MAGALTVQDWIGGVRQGRENGEEAGNSNPGEQG